MAKKKSPRKKSLQAPQTTEDPISFEEALAELEKIVAELEQGQLGLDESVERYEAGIKRMMTCYEALDRAEKKIRVLVNVDESGNANLTHIDTANTEHESFEPESAATPDEGETFQAELDEATGDGSLF